MALLVVELRQRLKMIRPNTRRDFAYVMDVMPIRNRANKKLVDIAMGERPCPAYSDPSVATVGLRALPEPAPVLVNACELKWLLGGSDARMLGECTGVELWRLGGLLRAHELLRPVVISIDPPLDSRV
ncbi:MAG TPA: hypothetical protein VFT43_01795 [Candidatus Polarisedimenticolia bacterium]|nr:hypothetical protein [Candidatus Polarisedimenticolia bacterium]